MVYGRLPRGPVEVWRDMLVATEHESSETPVFQYLSDLRERLSPAIQVANSSSDAASAKAKLYKDRNAKLRKFDVGDTVLLLPLTITNFYSLGEDLFLF